MTERPVTFAGLHYILECDLWQRGVKELKLLGMTPAQATRVFEEYARTGYKARILEFDGVPVVCVGIAIDEGGAFTWFQATPDFDKYAGQITRYIRREAAAYPGPLSIYSVCVHEDTERWFRVLGFVRVDGSETTLPSGAVLRRFDRR